VTPALLLLPLLGLLLELLLDAAGIEQVQLAVHGLRAVVVELLGLRGLLGEPLEEGGPSLLVAAPEEAEGADSGEHGGEDGEAGGRDSVR